MKLKTITIFSICTVKFIETVHTNLKSVKPIVGQIGSKGGRRKSKVEEPKYGS